MKARITQKQGKRVIKTAGYDNDEDALRREFGSCTELEELEAAGSLVDTGGGYCRSPHNIPVGGVSTAIRRH